MGRRVDGAFAGGPTLGGEVRLHHLLYPCVDTQNARFRFQYGAVGQRGNFLQNFEQSPDTGSRDKLGHKNCENRSHKPTTTDHRTSIRGDNTCTTSRHRPNWSTYTTTLRRPHCQRHSTVDHKLQHRNLRTTKASKTACTSAKRILRDNTFV